MRELDDLMRDFVGSIKQGPPLPLGPIGRTLVPGWVEWVRSGAPEADWWVCLSGFMGPVERYRALRRILERMKGPPISPIRWRHNSEALFTALKDMDVELPQLAEARGWEAMKETLDEAVDYTAPESTVPTDVMRAFSTALERLICEDLLGPGWRRRRRHPEEPLRDDLSWVGEEVGAAALAWQAVETLLVQVDLTPAERALWDAYRETDDWPAAGESLGLSADAIRQRKSRLLSKLAPIQEELQRV